MGEVPLSLHVSAEVKRRLEHEAARTRESESEIAGRAIEDYLARREALLAMLKEAEAEADRGVFISQEAMTRWMDSWNDNGEPELQMPEPDIFLPPKR